MSFKIPIIFSSLCRGCVSTQGCRELGGGPGQIFLGAPISKNFPDNNPPPQKKLLSSDLPQFFIPNFGTLLKKNKYLALCVEIFHPKK
jgi:hypothetical protein